MATTTLYFSSQSYSGINIPISNHWAVTGQVHRCYLKDVKDSPLETGSQFVPQPDTILDRICILQAVTYPIVNATVTFTSNTVFNMYNRALASRSGCHPRVEVRLFNSSGDLRTVCLSGTVGTETIAYNPVIVPGHKVYNGTFSSGVNIGINDGDYLVVEYGFDTHNSPTTSGAVKYIVGSTLSDLSTTGYMNEVNGVGWCSIDKRLEF